MDNTQILYEHIEYIHHIFRVTYAEYTLFSLF